jgi:hypothetical protein
MPGHPPNPDTPIEAADHPVRLDIPIDMDDLSRQADSLLGSEPSRTPSLTSDDGSPEELSPTEQLSPSERVYALPPVSPERPQYGPENLPMALRETDDGMSSPECI